VLTTKLVEVAATSGTDDYFTKQRFAWIQNLGEDLFAQRQALLTVAHLGEDNKHWVGLVVDAKENRVHHGNSLESPIPSDLLETYQWWIAQHSSALFELRTYQLHAKKMVQCVVCLLIIAPITLYFLMLCRSTRDRRCTLRGWCKGNLTDLRRILHLSLAKGNPK
jgi:hypothetical protein